MTDIAFVLLTNFAVLMGAMILLWLISIPLKDVSFIDSFWALGFVITALVTFAITPDGDPQRRLLLLGVTAVWGLRLGGYIFWRWRKEGPDKRYVALLSKAPGNVHLFSLTKVFLLQGVLLWLVSLPVQLGQIPAVPAGLGPLAWIGAGLAVIGIFFESVGDYQMARFKADPANAGKVMDRGLWRYTRHPNYFGDACVWWGLFLVAAETGPGRFSVVGPAMLTFLLVQWSGAALLERRMKRSRPDYEDYIRRTSSFIPMPPRRSKTSESGSA
jgi:steroid 5-alpha reductase family enzyme